MNFNAFDRAPLTPNGRFGIGRARSLLAATVMKPFCELLRRPLADVDARYPILIAGACRSLYVYPVKPNALPTKPAKREVAGI